MPTAIRYSVLSKPTPTEMGAALYLVTATFETAAAAIAYRVTVEGPSKVVAVRA